MNYFDKLFITDVTHISEISYEKKTTAQMNDRQAYGICFAKKGSVVYHHKSNTYLCDKDRAVIMPKGASYYWSCEAESSFLIINFLATTDFEFTEFLELPLKSPSFYTDRFSFLEKSFSMRSIIGNAEYLSVLYEIIGKLNKETDISLTSHIGNILAFINENFHDSRINNTLLAKRVNMSVSHFRSLFKKEYGISPMSYILNLRIENAKQLLLYSKLSVTEISEKCGFTNLYSFSRAFKVNTGTSPSDYAKQNKASLI